MKYSVVIPLYNKQQYIQKTLQSVLSQSYEDYEIIVVDDGSKDHSLAMARSVCSEKIKIIEQENRGVAAARNTGIENARGEYIAFLDADDEWHSDYLESINSVVDQFPECDMYVTAYRVVMGRDRFNYSARLSDKNCCIDSYWTTFRYAYDIVWTSAAVVRKSAIVKAGMFTPGELIGQDLDLWARVACNNPKVGYSPNVCVDYNRGAEQNARTRVRIANPQAFMSVLRREMKSERWTSEEKEWMLKKYNKKMIVYVFTTILANQRKKARQELSIWKENYSCRAIPLLYIASFLPNFINKFVYNIRLKVF